RALPDAAGDELERPRRDLLTGTGNADDDRLAPTAMSGFKRLPHDFHIARAVEGVIGAADRIGATLGQIHEIGHEIAFDLARIDEMRHAEFLAAGFLVIVEIDADDHVGPDEPQALDDVQPDAAEAEDDGRRAGFDLGRIDDRADVGSDAAADVAD